MIAIYERLVNRVSTEIIKGANIGKDEKKEIIHYGVDALLSFIITTIALIVTSYILGVLKYSLYIAFTSVFLRNLSGGSHCKTFFGCFFLTIICFSLLGFLPNLIPVDLLIPIIVLFGFFSLYIVFSKAPIDCEEKPIISENQRKYLRRASLVTVIIISLIQLILIYFIQDYRLVMSISLGLLWQSLQLTFIGKILTSIMDFLVRISYRREGAL